MAATPTADGDLKVALREQQQRKRTSSLGSHTGTHSSSMSSPEIALRGIPSSSLNGDARADPDAAVAATPASPRLQAWTGPRSGSAPPERRARLATTASESVPSSSAEDETQAPSLSHDGVAAVSGTPAEQGAAEEERADHHHHRQQQVDKLLLDGLLVAKDRLLLLRSDLEMEKLANDAARTRMRVAPPGFPPNLNSYQRLLIHRLADMWSITRELEPASTSNSPTQAPSPSAGSMISGTIVLVKTETTKTPAVRIASLAPPPTPDVAIPSTIPAVSLVSKVSELNLDKQNKATASTTSAPSGINPSTVTMDAPNHAGQLTPNSAASTSSQMSVSAASSSSASPAPSLGPVRIMSRAANAAARAELNKSRSPSAGSSTQGMTFEEREAAYQQARMRIFNESQKPATNSLEQQALRPSSMPPPQEYQHQHQHQQHQVQNPNQHQFHQQPPPFSQHQQPQQPPQIQHMHLNSMPLPGMQMNPSLRPSAPVFVYQPSLDHMHPQGHILQQQQTQQQPQVACYSVQPQPEGSMQTGPPIQITMSSPAPLHAPQPPVPVGYAAYPMQMQQQNFVSGHAPFSRPTSAHSHSSQSSISTTTSASSIRTASTSSAQRSTLSTGRGYASPGLNLTSMRQTSTHAGPSTRQVRPTARPSIGGSSTRSNVSTHSRNSQSSSSSPSIAGDVSTAVHPPSSHTSKSNSSSSSDKDLAASKEGSPSNDTSLAEPHPVLPARPDWIDSAGSSKTTSSSASSVSSNSSRERASDLTDEPSSIQRDDSHTPLSSTSGKTSSRGLDETSRKPDGAPELPVVQEDEAVDARSTPLPHSAPLPNDDASSALMTKCSTADKLETASQASSSRSSKKRAPANQPRVIENPPLRYDKQKGWTVLSSSALSQANQANQASQGVHSSTRQWKPPSPAASVASSSNWSQHAFQPSPHYTQPLQAGPNGHSHQGAPQYPLQQQQQYVMMPVPVGSQSQGFPVPAMQSQHFAQQQPYGHVQSSTSPQAVMMPLPSQQGYSSVQANHHQPQSFAGPSQYHGQQPVQVFFQPVQHAQPNFQPAPLPLQQQQHQQQQQQQPQQYGHFVQAQPYPAHVGGLTPADMMANGEMLYSYDLPRPVPRSGATLFDPNASN